MGLIFFGSEVGFALVRRLKGWGVALWLVGRLTTADVMSISFLLLLLILRPALRDVVRCGTMMTPFAY